jgi:hypothetical protein
MARRTIIKAAFSFKALGSSFCQRLSYISILIGNMRPITLLKPWMAFKFPLPSYITLLILASFVSADGTVTLYSLPAYTSQRACAQLCFYGCIYCGIGPWTAGIRGAVGCDLPFLDSCMCRTDLFSSASGYLSTCVSSACSSNSVDVNSALSIYGSYCAKANSPATNVATITPASVATTTTTTVATSGSSPSIQTVCKFPIGAFLAMVYLIIPVWYAPAFTLPIYA